MDPLSLVPLILPCTKVADLYKDSIESQQIENDNFPSYFSSSYEGSPEDERTGLAHDARNLLCALSLYCELLQKPGVLQARHRHYADELQLLSGQSQSMMSQLIDSNATGRHALHRKQRKVVDKKPEPQAERVTLPGVIDRCRGVLNAVARRTINVEYGAGAMLPIAVPHETLERILVNLVKNAAEASRTSTNSITLRVTCVQTYRGKANDSIFHDLSDYVVLSLEDEGCGMNPAQIQALLSEKQQRIGQHGIGFRVVRRLVQVSGGRIRVVSRCSDSNTELSVVNGTTVEIAWPVISEGGQMMPLSSLVLMTQKSNSEKTSC